MASTDQLVHDLLDSTSLALLLGFPRSVPSFQLLIDAENRLLIRNRPLIFVGTYNVPPATGINYSSWALVNIIINWWIKSRYFAWWGKLFHHPALRCSLLTYPAKYNYVLAAALDTGLALSALVIFFCITYPGGVFPDWWGEFFVTA